MGRMRKEQGAEVRFRDGDEDEGQGHLSCVHSVHCGVKWPTILSTKRQHVWPTPKAFLAGNGRVRESLST